MKIVSLVKNWQEYQDSISAQVDEVVLYPQLFCRQGDLTLSQIKEISEVIGGKNISMTINLDLLFKNQQLSEAIEFVHELSIFCAPSHLSWRIHDLGLFYLMVKKYPCAQLQLNFLYAQQNTRAWLALQKKFPQQFHRVALGPAYLNQLLNKDILWPSCVEVPILAKALLFSSPRQLLGKKGEATLIEEQNQLISLRAWQNEWGTFIEKEEPLSFLDKLDLIKAKGIGHVSIEAELGNLSGLVAAIRREDHELLKTYQGEFKA
ncbi:MAG: hypothetical protein WCG27_12690, partial [Pseudomonadota bacterium]